MRAKSFRAPVAAPRVAAPVPSRAIRWTTHASQPQAPPVPADATTTTRMAGGGAAHARMAQRSEGAPPPVATVSAPAIGATGKVTHHVTAPHARTGAPRGVRGAVAAPVGTTTPMPTTGAASTTTPTTPTMPANAMVDVVGATAMGAASRTPTPIRR